MGNYNKLFGNLIGGAIGLAAGIGLPVEWATPGLQEALSTLLGSVFGTYIARPNTG